MYVNADVKREEKSKQIAGMGFVFRIDDTRYRVKSQSGNGVYDVEETIIGWTCNCPDHTFRGMKCKHVWAVQISIGMRRQARQHIVLEPIVIENCPRCNSQNIRKDGMRHNKAGDIQRYECMDCGKKFSVNVGLRPCNCTLAANPSATPKNPSASSEPMSAIGP